MWTPTSNHSSNGRIGAHDRNFKARRNARCWATTPTANVGLCVNRMSRRSERPLITPCGWVNKSQTRRIRDPPVQPKNSTEQHHGESDRIVVNPIDILLRAKEYPPVDESYTTTKELSHLVYVS
eukprot:GHVO01014934.1.p1 GENE.GHVO01014934.1~~GHVO01014934.1.p1  ORF type:complete len:124 (+),score=11.86 GHVO01014934.1:96-467(+)